MTEIFAPVCSITLTKRRRFFWAAWWTSPPAHVPFKKPDASDGGATTPEEARASAEQRAGRPLVLVDPLWARAWIRILRGEHPWPTRESRLPRAARTETSNPDVSIWKLLGISRNATLAELKAAYRQRVLETHPDQGGDDAALREIVTAYAEAQRRLRKPRRKA